MRTWPALDVQRVDTETGDLVQAFLTDFSVAAIDDNVPDTWRVFFHDAGDRDRAAAALRYQFPDVAARAIDVPDQDWAARSQASLRAIQVGNIIVAPPWDVPFSGFGIRDSGSGIRQLADGDRQPEVGSRIAAPIVIIIQPSMGFGTGHHATTRLCLAALQQIDLRRLCVVDVGTGSGVLAIAASRLGAETVLALDEDADAVAAARENLSLNPDARVELRLADLRIPNPESRIPERFGVVVANLTGGLLIAAASSLRALTAPSGRLILSGFMDDEEPTVRGAFSDCVLESRARDDEWICVTLKLELAPDCE